MFFNKNIPDSENIRKSARSLIENFISSTEASDKLVLMQKKIITSEVPKKLIQDVTTRWCFTWLMIKILSKLSAPIDSLIASDQVQVKILIAAQKRIVTEIEIVLLPMATSQRFLNGQ